MEADSPKHLVTRRLFFSFLVLSGGALAQSAIIGANGQAKVCGKDTSPTKCPNGHGTCREIDKPVVVGNGDRYAPEVGQLFDYHLLRCDVCGVLFAEAI